MNDLKPPLLYFLCSLLMISFALIMYFLFSGMDWGRFFDAASIFLPIVIGLLLSLVIFLIAIYIFRKAFFFNRKKEHIRYL